MNNKQSVFKALAFIIILFAVILICIITTTAFSHAAMADEAEPISLGVEKKGAYVGNDPRYFKFAITKRSHVSIVYSFTEKKYGSKDYDYLDWTIINSSGNTAISSDDIEANKKYNNTTEKYSGSYGINLNKDTYYLVLKETKRLYDTFNFSFTIDAESIIALSKGKVSSLKSKKAGQFTVTSASDPNAIGYQIQYSTNERFKKSNKTIRSASTTATISKLTKGKYYYVRTRPYTIYTDGVYVYGQYSLPKSVKVKKK